jgi:hypothetical protein
MAGGALSLSAGQFPSVPTQGATLAHFFQELRESWGCGGTIGRYEYQ